MVRARAILRRFNGVLIADGVGLGKTFIGLALAAMEREQGGDAVAIVPSAVVTEWQRAAETTGTPITIYSHASLARRTPVPAARCSLVIVDEAHGFRNPRTRRYEGLARLTAGRRVALLTATPLNNTASDLAALIHLFAPRDRFREFGVADLDRALRAGDPAATLALGAVSVCRTRRLVEARFPELRRAFPRRVLREPARYDLGACYGGVLADLLTELDALHRGPETASTGAALLHLGLLRRLESSRAALRRSLARHRDVLDEVLRAAEQGVTISRADVRASFNREGGESQLALWPLLVPPGEGATREPLLAARSSIARALELVDAALPAADAKAAALEDLLSGPLKGTRTIVFTEYRDTALHLLRRLRERWRVIAVVGDVAYAGTTVVARNEALDGFAPLGRGRPVNPLLEADVLIATDVASEGLNLQDARAVVSYDLPWNPVRVMQRVGRIERLYSPHREIEVAHLVPAGGLRELTAVLRTLRGKLSAIAATVGAEPDPLAALWWIDSGVPGAELLERESWRRVAPFEARERWRSLTGDTNSRVRAPVVAAGIADDDEPAGAGVLLALEWRGGRRIPLPFVVSAGGAARRDPEGLGALAERALCATALPAESAQFTNLLASVMPEARAQLVALSASRRGGIAAGPGRQAAIDLLSRGAAASYRVREDDRPFERAGALLARDLPAGIDLLIGKLARVHCAPVELALRITELVSSMMPPAPPALDGTPRLILIAAILVASRCPSG